MVYLFVCLFTRAENAVESSIFLYARLKNGCIMLYPSASVRPSVRLSVRL